MQEDRRGHILLRQAEGRAAQTGADAVRKEGEEHMARLNTREYEDEILKYNTLPDAVVKSARTFKPAYEIPKEEAERDREHVPKSYDRHELGLALQAELERRFICLCEALYYDGLGNTYPDVALITEAVARYKEIYYFMDRLNIPPNFIFNTPSAYCNFFLITEERVRAAIAHNAEHLANNNGMPTADTMPLREYLAELNKQSKNF